MKIAWIYPHRDRCGIALYSKRYCSALDKRVETRSFDPADIFRRLNDLIVQINRCDLVHLQYETSFFMENNGDFYERLLQSIKPPVMVSLHEVYRTLPDVFPREKLTGSFIALPLKRMVYDYRHPLQTAYRKHLAHSFYAKTVFVHQEYHKEILVEQQIPGYLVSVLPHPVKIIRDAPGLVSWNAGRPAHLVGSGYINPHYDYELLFASLKRLSIPWRFTWIGGVRRDEDNALLQQLLHSVRNNGWEDCFKITGWLPEKDLDCLLCTADVFCALFSARSSSGSIASAIGAGRPILATPLPLTEELASHHGILHLVHASAELVAEGIEEVLINHKISGLLEKNVINYALENNYEAMADRLVAIYKNSI